jgi:hypothetical protein
MKRWIVGCGTWAVLLLAASAAWAQPVVFADRYSPTAASADGTGKRCMGREISAVMGWQGAAWLSRRHADAALVDVQAHMSTGTLLDDRSPSC